jgi:hypothetical protein
VEGKEGLVAGAQTEEEEAWRRTVEEGECQWAVLEEFLKGAFQDEEEERD